MKRSSLCLLLALAGCTTAARQTLGMSQTDCATDLLENGYIEGQGHKAQRAAEAYCRDYTAEQISTAKQMWKAGYYDVQMANGPYRGNFGYVLEDAKRYTAPQLKCAMQQFDADTSIHRRFGVSEECLAAQ